MGEEPRQDSRNTEGAQTSRSRARLGARKSLDGSLVQFLAELLAVQCSFCQAQRGAVLRPDGEKGFAILALHPRVAGGEDTEEWLQHCANAGQRALSSNAPIIVPIQGGDRMHVVLAALEVHALGRLLQAFPDQDGPSQRPGFGVTVVAARRRPGTLDAEAPRAATQRGESEKAETGDGDTLGDQSAGSVQGCSHGVLQ